VLWLPRNDLLKLMREAELTTPQQRLGDFGTVQLLLDSDDATFLAQAVLADLPLSFGQAQAVTAHHGHEHDGKGGG
jgi:hypothetical protein